MKTVAAPGFRHSYPELKDLVGKVISLCDEIATLALANEMEAQDDED